MAQMILAAIESLAKVVYTTSFVVGMATLVGVAIYLTTGVISSHKMWAGEHKKGSAVI
jgi:hypothetical protein